MSPNGPVTKFKSEYVSSEEVISENGVYEVAATKRGTFAVSGTVADGRSSRPPYDLPIEGAIVSFSSVEGSGLRPPPGGNVRVTTKTGYDGAFAVIHVPAGPSGTCYRMTVVAEDVGRYESFDVISAGVYDQSIELFGGVEREPFPYPIRGMELPPVARACARAAEDSG
jgi:hypothetical protein